MRSLKHRRLEIICKISNMYDYCAIVKWLTVEQQRNEYLATVGNWRSRRQRATGHAGWCPHFSSFSIAMEAPFACPRTSKLPSATIYFYFPLSESIKHISVLLRISFLTSRTNEREILVGHRLKHSFRINGVHLAHSVYQANAEELSRSLSDAVGDTVHYSD